MNYEETYIVEIRRADGRIDTEPYSDVVKAVGAYENAQYDLKSGERVQLHRTSSVILATSAKA
ncbi:hypothetical protein ABZ446_28665 [Streptomyces sp. NPDC005813]|uniref:hypothetical protein n=1 Tax=Streptomyces sp. NPDC005813 TaxID=3155592 RepID=UPI0033D43F70